MSHISVMSPFQWGCSHIGYGYRNLKQKCWECRRCDLQWGGSSPFRRNPRIITYEQTVCRAGRDGETFVMNTPVYHSLENALMDHNPEWRLVRLISRQNKIDRTNRARVLHAEKRRQRQRQRQRNISQSVARLEQALRDPERALLFREMMGQALTGTPWEHLVRDQEEEN